MPAHTLRRALRLAGAACAAMLLFVSLSAQFSFGGLSAQVADAPSPAQVNTAGTGTLLYTHAYGSGSTCSSVPVGTTISAASSFSCAGGIQPTAPTPATGTNTASDAITYSGSAASSIVTQSVSAATPCAPVQLRNTSTANAGNSLLTRYGTTFSTTTPEPMGNSAGSITLDGAATNGGYESAVTLQTQPNPGVSLTNVFALGIWFKTSSTAGGSLFGIGTSPANATGGNDRILSMTPSGTLSFIQNTSGSASAVTSTTKTYNDGSWHFAYVTMTSVSLVAGVTSTTTITVDSDPAVSGGGLLVGYQADSGYWHVGWSPVAGQPSYFAGSLSNFVVFNNGNAPTAPTSAQRASQTAFTSWASAASDYWLLNDAGTDRFAGTYPAGTSNPCASVAVTWGFSNPTSCAYSPASTTAACTASPAGSLAALADGSQRAIASPPSRTTQTSVITTSRGTGYDGTFAPGLHLYVPLTFTATAGTGWVNTFTWATAASAFIA